MVTRTNYSPAAVQAARSVLLELMRLLAGYRDEIVLVGGWVPLFLCPEAERPHVGSIDVDLALDHRRLKESGYRTIRQLLLERGYQQGNQPFIFERSVDIGGRQITVEVDLLSGEYEGTGRGHRTQIVQDVRPRKARGADLAFEDHFSVAVEGDLPDGGSGSAMLRVASIVPFLVMKGMAMDDRLKEKDAWDIYFCLLYFPGGLDAVVEAFRPHMGQGLVREGLSKIAQFFQATDSIGPTHVANFEEPADPEERARLRRDAFERVNYLLRELGVSKIAQ